MRYLLADMLVGRPNPNTHAYNNRDLVSEENLVADHPEAGEKLFIRHVEERFKSSHGRVIKRLKRDNAMDTNEELPNGDADNERAPWRLAFGGRARGCRATRLRYPNG